MPESPAERREVTKRDAPRVPDELLHPFDFERRRRSLRSTEAARPGVAVLLARLGVPDPGRAQGGDRALERLLLLFGTEVLLNISYYDRRAEREERKQWAMNLGLYGLALVFVGFALYVFVHDRGAAVAAVSQIAAAIGAILAGAKFVTESQDFQKTRSSFWQAGAELKERLYLFINEWCGRAWDAEDDRFAPEFVIALQGEIKRAREIQVEERRRFYDLMAAPTRLLGATQQLASDAQSVTSAWAQASQARTEQRRQHELETVRKLADDLRELYPDDDRRPAPVVTRLTELEVRARRLSGEALVDTAPPVAPYVGQPMDSGRGRIEP